MQEETMLTALPHEERLHLMKFLCSFAWADLRVENQERSFIAQMAEKLDLDEDDLRQVKRWLEVPPRAEEVDPLDVPKEHRRLFLDAARATVLADGEVEMQEAENIALLEQLMA